MSTVSASLRMFDMMTRPLQQVTQALNLTIRSMEQMNNAANGDIRITNSLNAARESARRAGAELQNLANEQDRAANSQNRLNHSMHQGHMNNTNFIQSIKGVAMGMLAAQAVMGSIQAIGNGINATDNYANQSARISLINDGLQTQAQLQDKIYQAAQRARSPYSEMTNSVAKLGLLAKDAFKGNAETIRFAELMNKSFKVSGSSISEASNGMYQLTQAMAAGRLQGDEFRSIMENAPMLAQAIATYTGKSMGKLKEMSADGVITSNIIKNALFSAADDINKKFATMPRTFGDIWVDIKNRAGKEFSGLMKEINGFINSNVGGAAVDNITNSIVVLGSMLGWIIDGIVSTSTFFYNNWSILEPIIWGLVAAMVAYNASLLVHKGYLIANNVFKMISTIQEYNNAKAILANAAAHDAQAVATARATMAQASFNTVLMASPITWIITAIIILITVFYAAIGAINKFAGTSLSATGMIAGAFMVAAAFIGNVIISAINLIIDAFAVIWNFVASFAEFFANVFNDPVGSIVRLFAGMADSILGILESIASAADTLFGSNLAQSVSGWRTSLNSMVTNSFGEAKIQVPRMDSSTMHLNRLEYGKAYNLGDSFGRKVEDKLSFDNLFGNGNSLKNNGLDKLTNGVGNIDKTLSNIDDKIDISNEHLEMLKDLAEMKSIQNFVTLTPTVQVKTGDIKETADINKIIAKIETYMENELVNSAEGVYASV